MGLLDAPGVSPKRLTRTSRQLFSHLPAPICAGRAIKPGSFSTLTGVTFQSVYTLYNDATTIRLAFPLFALPGSNNLTPEQFAGPLTIKANVIWGYNGGSGGTYVPVFFGGQRTVTTSYGQAFLISDPIDVAPSQAVGSSFVVRTYVVQSPRTVTDGVTNSTTTVTSATAAFTGADINAAISGSGIPGGATITAINSSTSVTISAAATATASSVSLTITPKYLPQANAPLPNAGASPYSAAWNEGYISGDFTDTAGNSWGGTTNDGATQYRPAVCGWPSTGTNRTTLCAGDSIMAGSVWAVESGSYSFASWALHQASIGGLNLGHGGEQLTTVLASYANQRARLVGASSCPNVIDEYGINDLFAGSRTATQLKADMLTWWGYLAKKGCAVYRTTLTPRTNSTDSWRTVGAQTSANTGAEVYRQAVNQWLRAPASAGAGASATYDAAQLGIALTIFDIDLVLEVNADGSAITINPTTGAISNGAGGYWLAQTTTYDTGTVTSIPTSQKLADTSKSWTAVQWLDYAMVITADATTPASVGQVRVISTNTTTQLSTDTAWTTTPSVGASYAIIKVFTPDGTHPLTFAHLLAAAKIDTTKLVTV